MSILSVLKSGSGQRRKTLETWDDLTAQLSAAQAELRQRADTVRHSCPEGRHPDWWAPVECPSWCPWCATQHLGWQLRNVRAIPAQAPSMPAVAAPADLPGSAFTQPEPESAVEELRIVADTPSGPRDSEAADVNAETQQVPVLPLQRALGLDDTAQLPTIAETAVDTSAASLQPAAIIPPLANPDRLVGFATSDLKDQVSPTAYQPGRTLTVRLPKTA